MKVRMCEVDGDGQVKVQYYMDLIDCEVYDEG